MMITGEFTSSFGRARTKQVLSLIVGVLGVGLVLSGCGGSSKSPTAVAGTPTSAGGSSASTTPSGAASPASSGSSGAPIKLMVIAPWDNPILDYVEVPLEVQVLADATNASGGIKGQKIQVISCNDHYQPSFAAICGREAVSDHVTALIGGFSDFDSEITPLLENAKIPWIGQAASDQADLNSPMNFSTDPSPLHSMGPAYQAGAAGCKRSVLIEQDTAVGAKPNYNAVAYKAATGSPNFYKTVVVPATATDLGPYASEAMSANADCFVNMLPADQLTAFIPSLQAAGFTDKQKVFTELGSDLTQVIVDQFPTLTEGWVAIDYYPAYSDALWSSFRSIMNQYKSTLGKYYGDMSGMGEARTDVGYQVFVTAANETQGPVTSASVLKVLTSSQTCDVKLSQGLPAMNYCQDNPVTQFARVFYPDMYPLVVKNGQFVDLQPGAYGPSGYVNLETVWQKGQ
jgi:ABC-type branched-subunit amino acid transport system substrate-binding protein